MNFVYAITKDYQKYILPSVRSLVEHNPSANIFIVTETDEVSDLPCDATIINVSNQELIKKESINYYNGFTYINLLKVYYPTLLPVNKVIHLDADTIICENLQPMWDVDLTNKWVGACLEQQKWYKPFGDKYYNMGVAVINLQQMRDDHVESVLGRYLSEIKQPFADQDAWNKFGIELDMFVELPNRYNSSGACGYVYDNPAIVHLCGWRDWYTNPDRPQYEYLVKYKGLKND